MTITMRQARKLLIPVPLIDLNFIVSILLVASLCKSVLRRLLQSFNPSTLQLFNPSILQLFNSSILHYHTPNVTDSIHRMQVARWSANTFAGSSSVAISGNASITASELA